MYSIQAFLGDVAAVGVELLVVRVGAAVAAVDQIHAAGRELARGGGAQVDVRAASVAFVDRRAEAGAPSGNFTASADAHGRP